VSLAQSDTRAAALRILRLPMAHSRTMRMTDFLERLFVEERRRSQDHSPRLRRNALLN
jgi:hypothetical protein